MTKRLYVKGALAALSLMVPAAAAAQQAPTGSEIVGHSVQVTTNGVTNIIHFDPGGTARVLTPQGNEVRGFWSVADNMLCLTVGAGRECFPYQQPFVAGQPVTLTSSCAAVSMWTPVSTAPLTPALRAGERG